jgi:mono/diheme cytochrome c family protein
MGKWSMKRFSILAALLALLGIAAYYVFKPKDEFIPTFIEPTAELAARGEKIYADNCAVCHGANREGQPNWRDPLPEGGLPAPPHDESGHTWHHPDPFLFLYVKEGGAPFMPQGMKSNMPGLGQVLKDADILAVLSFIKSRWAPEIQMRQKEITRRALAQQK